MPVKKITRIALLSAILYVSKVVLEFLPNVELVSFLILIYTLVFGSETLLVIALCLAAFVPDCLNIKKGGKRRIFGMGNCFGGIWPFLWGAVCSCLSSGRPVVCSGVLDLRSSLGCVAWGMEFCFGLCFRKTSLSGT